MIRRLILVAGLIGVAGALSACSALNTLDALTPEDGYSRTVGVPFGAHSRQRLDVYRPAAAPGRAPVLVFFYGGGWREGDRASYRFVGQSFASAGYVTVVADYRLWPEVRFPAFVEDGAAAVAWVQRHIASEGGDPNRIFLMGHSAGAHLVAMLHADRAYLDQAGFKRPADGASGIAGTIGIAGPYDFRPSPGGRFADILAAGGPRPYMPIDLIEGREGPLMLVHGEIDAVVGVINARRLAERVREKGGHVDLVTYGALGHGPIVAALATPLTWLGGVRDDILAWMRARG
jgi:acetyl esterase/lipase